MHTTNGRVCGIRPAPTQASSVKGEPREHGGMNTSHGPRPMSQLMGLVMVCSGVLLAPADLVAAASTTTYEQIIEQLTQALRTCRTLSQRLVDYDAVFRRDPMQALIDAQGQLVTSTGLHSGLAVQGIIWSDQHPLAVIDDELFSPGAVVGPYTILDIQPQGVVVQRGKDELFIPLDRGLGTAQEQSAGQPGTSPQEFH